MLEIQRVNYIFEVLSMTNIILNDAFSYGEVCNLVARYEPFYQGIGCPKWSQDFVQTYSGYKSIEKGTIN